MEVKGRRKKIEDEKVDKTTNASLWLDKYIASHKDNDSKKNLVDEVSTGIHIPNEYHAFFERWRELHEEKCSVRPRVAEAHSRLAIGLGAGGVLETSITLNHTYGTPYIPGSALKGLAAHYARNILSQDWRKEGEAYKELFGSTEKSGCVDFYDALYIPKRGSSKQALWSDIITVHHPKYYQGEDKAPADWDSPTPIPFLTATGKYLIALDGPVEWVEVAYEILGHALYQFGVGAKTSSGYGRMDLEGYEPPKAEKKAKTLDLKSLEKHKGIISKFYSDSGKGKIRDEETGKEYEFTRSALPKGKDFPRKQKVYFKLDKESGKVVEIKKDFST